MALPFVFYASNSKEPRDHNILDRGIVTLSAPVQWLTVAVLDGVAGIWRRYIFLVNLEAVNEQLRRENATLLAEIQAREEARLENERLHRLVSVREPAPQVQTIVAYVIATAPTPLFRSIRVDRGAKHGVHRGAAVVNHDGVVGRVVALGPWHADIMLLVDADNSVDVLVQRTRARARVRGVGGDKELGVEVHYLARTDDVEPGDVLITSGTGTVFPKGLIIGTVIEVEAPAFGLHQRARVEPSVDFSRIEEVMIIPRGWPEDSSFETDEQASQPEAVAAMPEEGPAPPLGSEVQTEPDARAAPESQIAPEPELKPQPALEAEPQPELESAPAPATNGEAER